MRTPQASGLAAAVALSALLAACDSEPKTSPSPGVTRVEINGPSSIVPGQTANYSVIEYLSNGTTRALPHANWSTTDKNLVQITSGGVATAVNKTGEVMVTVQTTRSANKEVTVMPAGTYRLVGSVTDADRSSLPIPDAVVEVVGGPSTRTNSAGQYRLYGVPPDAQIRVTRGGYVTLEERVQLSGNASRVFRLGVDGASRDYEGNYTLIVQAVTVCNSNPQLGSDLRRRQYEASVHQNGPLLEVRLTEPRFAPSLPDFASNRFTGYITPAGATFSVTDNYYYYSPYLTNMTELLPDNSLLYIYGTAVTTGSPSGLSGTFSGWFSHVGGNRYLGGCQAATFALTPR